MRSFKVLLGVVVGLAVMSLMRGDARAQTQVKPRFVIVLDTSGSMMRTPELVDLPNIAADDGLPTHGDGSNENVGCQLDSDVDPVTGYAFNDSRMYNAKQAISSVVSAFGEVEFALAGFRQLFGTCSGASTANCPLGPDSTGANTIALFDTCENNTCKITTASCSADNYDECTSTFTCNVANCGPGGVASCDNNRVDDTCEGDNLNAIYGAPWSTAVDCFDPANDSRRVGGVGAYTLGGVLPCLNASGRVYETFPATSTDDNYIAIRDWIDHDVNDGKELRTIGPTPLGGTLSGVRDYLVSGKDGLPAVLPNDTESVCRDYAVILITDGIETCGTDPVAAATALRNSLGEDVKTYVIALALCPAGMSSCPAKTSLDAIAAAGGTGTAIAVTTQEELAAAIAEIVAGSIKTEVCDGADNDCDGDEDEDFPELDQTCTKGVGACLSTGVRVCKADGSGTECNAPTITGTMEVCNNVDDDCNGLVDDGISCDECIPSTEVCNGKDDDCDLAVDEDFVPESCGTDTGLCSPGTTACVGGTPVCQGGTGPAPEICDGFDNNCDTITDGISRPCYGFASGCNLGAGTCQGKCQLGTQTCVSGNFNTECVNDVGPSTEIPCNLIDDDCDGTVDEGTGTEVCDGVDNDCDGMVDEGTLPAPIGNSCGTPPFTAPCKAGTIQCVAGVPTCQGEIDPTTEACDGVDNNCNGTIDDNIPGFGGPCGDGTGECVPGTLRCIGGAPVCDGEVGPAPEVCDCDDNDCDVAVDESDPMLGTVCNTLPGGGVVATETGACQFGVRTCSATLCALTCTGAVGPTPEKCNGIDDDCDGPVDEDFPLGAVCDNGMLGACKFTGVTICKPDGSGTQCTAPAGSPATEVCNGIDDDCDGMTDEGDLPLVGDVCRPAVGSCPASLWICDMGDLVCPDSPTGGTEICNGIDDNCNQLIDEEPPPLPGTDQECVPPGTDPGLVYTPPSTCRKGATICLNGEIACDGFVGPLDEELCDSLDNDCDGVVDEMAECPIPTDLCYEGECVKPCGPGEFPCPGGYVCESFPMGTPPGDFCIEDPCFGVTCDGGEACDRTSGECVPLCDLVECNLGRTCVEGACVDCFDPRIPCMDGMICVRNQDDVGECVPDPCPPGMCGDGQICVVNGAGSGVCVEDCTGDCPLGERCDLETGECVFDPCAGVSCADTTICDPSTGECVTDNCTVVVCQPGEACVPETGECIGDPCLPIECQDGTHCEVDFTGMPECVSDVPPPPPGSRVDVLATGGGGCACEVGGDRDADGPARGPLALLAVALVGLWGARRRRGGAGGGR